MVEPGEPGGAPTGLDGFRFRGGHAALDLTATLLGRLKPVPRELLADSADLDRWLAAAGVAAFAGGASGADLQVARELREAIFKLAEGAGEGAFDRRAVKVINRTAAFSMSAPALGADGRIEWDPSASDLLCLLAREAIHLFGGKDAGRVRQCEASACTIFFIDTSRSGDRRWCSMAACGNKAKVAEFRRRKRENG